MDTIFADFYVNAAREKIHLHFGGQNPLPEHGKATVLCQQALQKQKFTLEAVPRPPRSCDAANQTSKLPSVIAQKSILRKLQNSPTNTAGSVIIQQNM